MVTPLLSLRPAVENNFWLTPTILLNLKTAPIVSMLDLNITKCTYLCRAAGFIFFIFLLSLSFILLPSKVFDSILTSFYLTNSWIFIRYSLFIAGMFSTKCSHWVIFSPASSFLYNYEIAYAVSELKCCAIPSYVYFAS